MSDLNEAPRVNRPNSPLAPLPRSGEPAHLITSDAEAIEIAHALAATFAEGAALRDREGLLPISEVEAFSQSGLWGITIPKAYGGAGVPFTTLTEVLRIIASADPAVAQITLNHFAIILNLRLDGSEKQKQFFFGEVLRGLRFGNADSERHGKTVAEFSTRILRIGDHAVVNGEKFYATGALFAHMVWISGLDDRGKVIIAFVNRDTPGLTVINDWSSFGQRGTASGTVLVKDVRVPLEHLLPAHTAFDRPTAAGPFSQVMHAAIDTGIAAGALADAIKFIRNKARTWIDSGKEKASEDPFTIAAIGDLEIRLHAAEALLVRAAERVQHAIETASEDSVSHATLAAAEAKVLSSEVAILATNKVCELGGSRSTLAEHGLDRHWRNARTHTLHDPVRWKPFHIGNYYLNGVIPIRHPWI